ncbi:MAG: alpha/beta hydrolase [Anaerolineae bacterium]|nr:alpha/beta hydrolase [Anaerolineae bacterium]
MRAGRRSARAGQPDPQPTLILHGERDCILPVDSSRWLASRVPNSFLISFAGAGHVPTMTRPAEIANAINHFFERR